MPNSKIISIGDEILIGQIVNSNAAFISEKLYSIGLPVRQIISIGDTEDDLINELYDSVNNYEVTIITGGLGPTHDDITKPVLTKYFNDELILNENVLENVKNIFQSRGFTMPGVNVEQAMIPKSCNIIWNPNGTAPGMSFEKEGRFIISLPGVPFEMKEMMNNSVIPMLHEKFKNQINYVLKSKTFLTFGLGETFLSEMIGDEKEITGENNKMAYLPSAVGVRLRVDVKADNEDDATVKLQEIEGRLRSKVGDYIFGINEDKLEKIVGELLIKQSLTIAFAESCTGGMLSGKITDIPGSSVYFKGGIVCYSNESKISLLAVKDSTINNNGAVSKETAIELAENVRIKMNSDIGISITGIAGPAGGSDEKPVGMVWIGYSDGKETFTKKYLFGENRERTRLRSATAALDIVRRKLLNLPI
jgi:nicotinamide-nucleotide amidase